MAEYIEREAALAALDELERTAYHNSVLWPDHVEECRECLRDFPAADVVPVVRCKDCKHGTRLVCDLAGNEGIECRHGNIAHMLDWFCADGAKMDGEA